MKERLILAILILLSLGASARVAAPVDSVAFGYSRRGMADMQAQRFTEALDNFITGMKLAGKSGDSTTYNTCQANIAAIYGYTGNFDRSLHYLLRAYDRAVSSGDSVMRAQIVVNLVGTYCKKGDLENARRFFIESNRFPLPDIKMQRHYFLYNQALISRLSGNDDLAMYYYRQAADYALDNNDFARAATQYVGMAGVLLGHNKPDEALDELRRGEKLASEWKMPVKMLDIYSLMQKAMLAKGDSAAAAVYANRRLALSDSIFGSSQMKRAENSIFDYENDVYQANIGRLTEDLRVNRLTLVFSVILIAVMAVFIVVITINMRKLRRSRLRIIERNEALRLLQYAPIPREEKKGVPLSLAEDQVEEIKRRILEVMNDIAIISRDDFSLATLAELTHSNTKYVSKVINDSFGKNFRTLLNEYRIREACNRLADTEHYGHLTIMGIYRGLGYSSAGGFIEAFKKINGMSPSVYQKLARSRKE